MSNIVAHEDAGRSWSERYQVLDRALVRDAEESAVQAWLTEHHTKIGGWWCQVITSAGPRRSHLPSPSSPRRAAQRKSLAD